MKIFSKLCTLLLAFLAISCNSDTLNDWETDKTEEAGQYTYRLHFNCQSSDANMTRTTYDWNTGDEVYIRFEGGTAIVEGIAKYDGEEWYISSNSAIPETSKGTCSATFIENGAQQAESIPYQGNGTYTHTTSSGDVFVNAIVNPTTWRLRFSGTNGTEVVIPASETDFLYFDSYKSGKISYQKKDVKLIVKNGYTPYIYGILPESGEGSVVVQVNGEKYTRGTNKTEYAVRKTIELPLPNKSNYQSQGWTLASPTLSGEPCFLYVPSQDAFVSRGQTWGTRITLDRYGVCVKPIKTDLGYQLMCVDDTYDRFIGDEDIPYADKTVDFPINWTFEYVEDGNLVMHLENGKYLKDSGMNAGCSFTTNKSEATRLRVVYADEYNRIQDSRKTLASEIPSGYVEMDVTSLIKNPTMSQNIDYWTNDFWASVGSVETRSGLTEAYQQVGEFYQDITGLEPGIYKFTLEGFYRGSSNQRCAMYAEMGITLGNAYIFANDAESRIASWASARQSDTYPNSMEEAYTLISKGLYKNEVYGRVGNDGRLRIGIALPQYVPMNWMIWRNAKLYKYDVSGEHKYVDLGLSVKWATCNVGASSPEDYGDYYAWGETETKNSYSWSTYKWCNGSYNSLTRYCTSSSYGKVDNKTQLDPSDDVAHVKWGGSWRMPTRAEQDELRENCTWTWTTQGGKNGYKVTSKKNGNSIFLPAVGYRDDSGLYSAGSFGVYWSSSLYSGNSSLAYDLNFGSGRVGWIDDYRFFGFSIRPVCP